MSIEWPSVDGNGVSLPTIVSTSDLFEGELFGDELIDIYNTSAADDGNSNDIPHILSPGCHDGHMENDEAVQIAAAAAAMDDGLGAFRPSTSFSDLTSLLHPSGELKGNSVPPDDLPSMKGTKKRTSFVSSAQPAAKRKATAPKPARRVSSTSSKKAPATAAAPASKTKGAVAAKPDTAKKAKGNTPDPLDDLPEVPAVAEVPKGLLKPDDKRSSAMKAAPGAPSTFAKDDAVSRVESDSDFHAIAQVAVSNLMMNATSTKNPESVVVSAPLIVGGDKVDISTDHVKALTGNNWVTACSNSSQAPSDSSVNGGDAKGNNRSRRQNLTPDERARQNRDRNREHARNTRLRKKAYVEELKRTLTELVAQRDASELEKRQAAQRELEQREVRFRVLEEFLKLRGRNEANFARWAAILEDKFTFTVPVVSGQIIAESVLSGVSEVMAESSAFASLLQTLGNVKGSCISFHFVCDRKNFFMDDCNGFLEWTASTSGAVATGAQCELALKGVVRGKFSPASNKLISASMTFDTSKILFRCAALSNPAAGNATASADIEAAKAADAILDSLQMPRLAVPASVPAAVNVVHSSCSSSEEASKGDVDSDESVTDEKAPAVKCEN
ncbi:hypothetical protein FisN_3Lh280 [Fistulifera solaris]|uniref:BZIP domain-containing protein n=1 Tax=Fistulifera solaris TaxID=1519565 RepID=A0A1Z5J7X6_FISSO|nr:hypothetical protein FisN_3Lh280 [Fistulifera solaris]|eukprot:GAX10095.1 hypothetical protein FisN_3Lh280 [Fistulifera solaris]